MIWYDMIMICLLKSVLLFKKIYRPFSRFLPPSGESFLTSPVKRQFAIPVRRIELCFDAIQAQHPWHQLFTMPCPQFTSKKIPWKIRVKSLSKDFFLWSFLELHFITPRALNPCLAMQLYLAHRVHSSTFAATREWEKGISKMTCLYIS